MRGVHTGLAAVALVLLLLTTAGSAEARAIGFDLKVVGERGEPVDGATIWFLCETARRRDLRVEDMQRMTRRYYRDVDFIFEKSLHPELLIQRTHATGIAKIVMDDSDRGKLSSMRISIAVIKRGWIPEVLSSTGRDGQKIKLEVRLKRDPSWASDPRLEQLDHLRAIAEAGLTEEMSLRSQTLLVDIGTQLRKLAKELENEGLSDAAAAVYYNLAYLPSVTVDSDPSGGIALRGYSRGFDDSSKQRVTDRARAWTLVRERPALEYQRVLETHKANGLMGGPSDSRESVRREYLAITERFFRDYPEQMWPTFHVLPAYIYGAQGNPDQACTALREFFEIEPSFNDEAGWKHRLETYEADVKFFHTTPTRKCELPYSHERVSASM
jgi:hypothetical protein